MSIESVRLFVPLRHSSWSCKAWYARYWCYYGNELVAFLLFIYWLSNLSGQVSVSKWAYPRVERGKIYPTGQFVSCLKARKMIYKGIIYHLFRVRDIDSKTHTLELVPLWMNFGSISRWSTWYSSWKVNRLRYWPSHVYAIYLYSSLSNGSDRT